MIDPATGQQLVAAPMMAHAHGQVFQVTRDSTIKLFVCLSLQKESLNKLCFSLMSFTTNQFTVIFIWSTRNPKWSLRFLVKASMLNLIPIKALSFSHVHTLQPSVQIAGADGEMRRDKRGERQESDKI